MPQLGRFILIGHNVGFRVRHLYLMNEVNANNE